MQPLSEIDLENPLENNDVYDELAPFLTRISRQNRQIQQQMRLLEERQSELNTITEQMDEGLLILDHHAKVLSINRRAAEIFSVTGDCVGRHIFAVNRSAEVMPVLEHALEGQEAETQLEIGGKTYQFLATPVRVENQQKGVVLLILDITQRHQAEQLRREFSANVSHELKTPMTTIGGFIDGILDGTIDSSKSSYYLRIVSDEVKRLSRLVTGMLNMSKIEAGQLKIQPKEFDISAMTFKTMLGFERIIDEKKIEVRGLDKVGPVNICADEDMINQVVYNLIDNAVKFTDEGGYIEVAIKSDSEKVIFSVKNSGKGISHEDAGQVFERFYKTDKSRSYDVKGAGLGLYIVKTVIDMHGGQITVNSEPGEYTQFVFWLPLR